MNILTNIFIIIFMGLFLGCSAKPYIKETKLLMGTLIEITCQDKEAIKEAFKEIERLENLLSKFNPKSEISTLNKQKELLASETTCDIIKKAIYYSEISGGAFDISIAPLSDIWKKAISEKSLPKHEIVLEKLNNIGNDKIIIKECFITLKNNASLDLGGIAKGYAVDKAIKKIRDMGIESAMVNAGGNIYCLGKKQNKKWKIGIQDPRNPNRITNKIELENQAVATSGDYEQYFEVENKRYSHIINPKTGYPVNNGIISVTVIANDATTADILSTSCFVLGEENSNKLINNFPGAAIVNIVKNE